MSNQYNGQLSNQHDDEILVTIYELIDLKNEEAYDEVSLELSKLENKSSINRIVPGKINRILHTCYFSFSLKLVKLLLEFGADPNTKNYRKETILYLFVNNNIMFNSLGRNFKSHLETMAIQIEIIETLVNFGADISFTPKNYPFIFDVVLCSVEILNLFLVKDPSLIYSMEKNRTLLMTAVGLHGRENMNCLLNYGLDPNFVNSSGESALSLAVSMNHYDSVKILLKHGAKITPEIVEILETERDNIFSDDFTIEIDRKYDSEKKKIKNLFLDHSGNSSMKTLILLEIKEMNFSLENLPESFYKN